jgi:signal transduction histidine kinase
MAGLVSVLSAVFAWFYVGRSLAPLEKAARTIHEMASGRRAPQEVPMEGAPEIQRLLGSFNLLHRKIAEKEAAREEAEGYLQDRNRQLEREVRERRKVEAELLMQTLLLEKEIHEHQQAFERQSALEAQLRQAQKMESLGILAGGVAHDMNNVLGAILGLASAHLELDAADSQAHRAFETITKAAIRGGQMVKSLLSFARQSPAEERDLDLNAILREEAKILDRTTLSRIRLEMDLAADLGIVRGDPSALTHAFMNLCINALDAMPDAGTLTLRTRNAEAGWVEVRVEDTGTGMPKEVLDRALDPFFTTKDHGKGTGLGLSMVYSTVKAHQGTLALQSEPGRGTSVCIRFPTAAPRLEATASPAGPPSHLARVRLQVLLIDDDELIQSSTQSMLEVLGHRATAALSGESALARIEGGFQPDAILLDMNMPGLGGAGTLPRLRALLPQVPILLATGRADQGALDLIEAYSNVSLLSKPFSLAELAQRLEGLGRG